MTAPARITAFEFARIEARKPYKYVCPPVSASVWANWIYQQYPPCLPSPARALSNRRATVGEAL